MLNQTLQPTLRRLSQTSSHLLPRYSKIFPTAAMSNRASFLQTQKILMERQGEFVVQDAEIGQPEKGEVLIKVHAAAIQPVDTKVAILGMIPMEYPTVLGSPVAGTVEALGPGVTKVSIGERVACGCKVLVHKKPKYGGLQRYTVVDESEVVEIGDVDFATATTLISYTPPGALFGSSTLHMQHPTIPASPLPAGEQGKEILIWGGSSSMGVLSISYAKAAGYTVVSTSSPHNFDLLRSAGADHIFDHRDPNAVAEIRKLFPIDYWLDTVSLPASLSAILEILAPKGEPVTKADVLLLLPPNMPGNPEPPEGVTFRMHRFSTQSPENADWAKWLLARGGYLEKAIKQGVIKGVTPDVIGGLDKVPVGIDAVHKGVSGKKIVFDPWL